MARKKTEEKEDACLDILSLIEEKVHPFMRQGFKEWIWDKKVKTENEFDKLLKEYGG